MRELYNIATFPFHFGILHLPIYMCVYGQKCVCWDHWSTDVLSPYGWQVVFVLEYSLLGDLAAHTHYLCCPLLSSTVMQGCFGTSHVVRLYDCSLQLC